MRRIRLIGVLLVSVLLALGACASTAATDNNYLTPAAAPGPGTVPAAPAVAPAVGVVQNGASVPAAGPVPTASPTTADAADFALSNLKITPGSVAAGNDVTVAVTVTNPGGQAGTNKVTVNLIMEGDACPTFIPPTQDVTLAGGASQVVTFTLSMGPESAGSYTVMIGKLSGKLEVQ